MLDVGAGAFAHQLQAQHRDGEAGRDQRGHEGVTERAGHQTFSTSGLPSRPLGRNSRMRISRLMEEVPILPSQPQQLR